MSIWEYLTTPMGQQQPQNPMSQQMTGMPSPPMQGFAGQLSPLTWAGLGMLSDSGYSRRPQEGFGRAIGAGLGGLQMGNQMMRQEQAQQLEWAKLQQSMSQGALEREKLSMEIQEARRKRKEAQLAKQVIGTPGYVGGERQEGPFQPGTLPPGLVPVPGTGYLGGELTPEQTGALLAGTEGYEGVAKELLARGEPLKGKEKYMPGDDGALWDVSGPKPRLIRAPGAGLGVGGGNIWADKTVQNALKGVNEADYKPDSVMRFAQAVQSGDPNAHKQLQQWGTYEGPNLTASVVKEFKDDFRKSITTAREGAASIKKMMATLNKPGSITDIAAIYGFIKAIDPGSVVREGEVHIMQAARSLSDHLKGWLQKNQNKGFLTEGEREQLSEIGVQLMGMYKESEASWRNHYQSEVMPTLGAGGVTPAMMMGPPTSYDVQPYVRPTAPGQAAPGQAAPAPAWGPEQQSRLEELQRKQSQPLRF